MWRYIMAKRCVKCDGVCLIGSVGVQDGFSTVHVPTDPLSFLSKCVARCDSRCQSPSHSPCKAVRSMLDGSTFCMVSTSLLLLLRSACWPVYRSLGLWQGRHSVIPKPVLIVRAEQLQTSQTSTHVRLLAYARASSSWKIYEVTGNKPIYLLDKSNTAWVAYMIRY